MPVNALAPPSRNALQELLTQAAASPQYGALVDYLTARRRMPIMQYGGVLSPDATAEFQTGANLPVTGQIALRNAADPNTVVHELTHAALNQINNQWSAIASQPDRNLTPDQIRFKQAYEKLIFKPGEQFGANPKSTQQATARKIAPQWAEENKRYRASDDELSAFGMGGSVRPNLGANAPLHIDPAYATEFSVLLDLARRAQPVIPGR